MVIIREVCLVLSRNLKLGLDACLQHQGLLSRLDERASFKLLKPLVEHALLLSDLLVVVRSSLHSMFLGELCLRLHCREVVEGSVNRHTLGTAYHPFIVKRLQLNINKVNSGINGRFLLLLFGWSRLHYSSLSDFIQNTSLNVLDDFPNIFLVAIQLIPRPWLVGQCYFGQIRWDLLQGLDYYFLIVSLLSIHFSSSVL